MQTTRDESAIEWQLTTEGYAVVDVQVERYPRSLSVDIILEDGEVLQRVIPVPSRVLDEDSLPVLSTRSGVVLIRWTLPRSTTPRAAPLATDGADRARCERATA